MVAQVEAIQNSQSSLFCVAGLPMHPGRLSIYETNLPGFVRKVELFGGTAQLPDTAVVFNADPTITTTTPGAAWLPLSPTLAAMYCQSAMQRAKCIRCVD